jgi:hypothetical protein
MLVPESFIEVYNPEDFIEAGIIVYPVVGRGK